MSRPEMRERLAALSFSEKIRILEKLRDRSRVIAASRTRLLSAGADTTDQTPIMDVRKPGRTRKTDRH